MSVLSFVMLMVACLLNNGGLAASEVDARHLIDVTLRIENTRDLPCRACKPLTIPFLPSLTA